MTEQADLNMVVLQGTLAVDGELRTFDSGARLIRYLVTVRVEHPSRRVDVIPATLWDPTDEQADEPGNKGDRIWLAGSVQRRYWESPDGRRSRVEVVAHMAAIGGPFGVVLVPTEVVTVKGGEL